MFFKVNLKQDLLLEPKDMGKHVKQKMDQLLRTAVEGKLLPAASGFVIAVLQILSVGSGRLDNSLGSAIYRVQYSALVFRPFAGQVVDALVTSCNAYGINCTVAGMLTIFVHRSSLPSDLYFEEGAWLSNEDKDVGIRINCGLRVRIISFSFDGAQMNGLGTINDDYCGIIFVDKEEAMDEEPLLVQEEEEEEGNEPVEEYGEEGPPHKKMRNSLLSPPSAE